MELNTVLNSMQKQWDIYSRTIKATLLQVSESKVSSDKLGDFSTSDGGLSRGLLATDLCWVGFTSHSLWLVKCRYLSQSPAVNNFFCDLLKMKYATKVFAGFLFLWLIKTIQVTGKGVKSNGRVSKVVHWQAITSKLLVSGLGDKGKSKFSTKTLSNQD